MDIVPKNMTVLDGDEIQPDIIGRPVYVAVLNIHVLALISLEDFLSLAVPVDIALPEEHIFGGGYVKSIAAGGWSPSIQVNKIYVLASGDF